MPCEQRPFNLEDLEDGTDSTVKNHTNRLRRCKVKNP